MLTHGQQNVFGVLYKNSEGIHIRAVCRKTGLSLPAVKKILDCAYDEGIVKLEVRGRMKIFRLDFASPQAAAIVKVLDTGRFNKLPFSVRDCCNKLMGELKELPLLAVIFGSYGKGRWTKTSDLDILLVFQRLDSRLFKSIERSARIISGRTGIAIQPVSLAYGEFERKFLDKEDQFMLDVRGAALPIAGSELWYKLLARFLA